MMMTLTLPYLKVQPDSPLRGPFLQPAGLATAHGCSLWKSILKIKPNINDIIIWGSQHHCHVLISYIFCVAIFHHISTFCHLVGKSNRDLTFQNKATREQKRCAVGTTMQWLWILCINVNFNRTKIPPKKLMWLGFLNWPKPNLTRTNQSVTTLQSTVPNFNFQHLWRQSSMV